MITRGERKEAAQTAQPIENVLEKQLSENVHALVHRTMFRHGIEVDKSASEVIRDCVLELLSSLSYDSLTLATVRNKSVVSSTDVMESLNEFGFTNYLAPVEGYLKKWHLHTQTCQECGKWEWNSSVEVVHSGKQAVASNSSAQTARRPYQRKQRPDSKPGPVTASVSAPTTNLVSADPAVEPSKVRPTKPRKETVDWSNPAFVEYFRVQMEHAATMNGTSRKTYFRALGPQLNMTVAALEQHFQKFLDIRISVAQMRDRNSGSTGDHAVSVGSIESSAPAHSMEEIHVARSDENSSVSPKGFLEERSDVGAPDAMEIETEP